MENNYEIRFRKEFKNDFFEIFYYIYYKLENEIAANSFYTDILNSIKERSSFPEIFQPYKPHSRKWYRIYMRNFTIFYTVRDNTMEIVHVIYSARNLERLV